MELALAEARKGIGRTSPNPAVGAVIVNQDEIVGRGYHKKAGTPHAEVHAIADAGVRAKGATLYVTLEPCNHTGRTPPCTEAILRSGITTVIIGMLDPNPRVAGGGAAYLKEQGVEVRTGVSEQACRALNYSFIKHSATGLPWVIMKAGLSLDGKITLHPRQGTPITGPESQRFVHRLRNQVDAILVGVDTAVIDNPSLTTRIEGLEGQTRDPLRIVLDSSLRLPTDQRMLTQDSDAETWVFCGEDASSEKERELIARGARVCRIPTGANGRVDLPAVLAYLGTRNITSILVEGGARVHGAFYGQQLVDELILLYAPFIIGDKGTPLVDGYSLGNREQVPMLSGVALDRLGDDILLRALLNDLTPYS
mgnify:CR=1 FL=1